MGIALELYTKDNNGYPYYVMPVSLPSGDDQWFLHWEQVLGPYWQHTGQGLSASPGVNAALTNMVFTCPGYKGVVLSGWGSDETWNWSYSYNAAGLWPFSDASGESYLGLSSMSVFPSATYSRQPLSSTRVVAPSEMFAMMDAQEGSFSQDGLNAFDWTCCNNYNPFAGCAGPSVNINTLQHGKLINIVYCDTHAASIPLVDAFNPTNSGSHWAIDHQPHPDLWHSYDDQPVGP
jgi:hypothetical protein